MLVGVLDSGISNIRSVMNALAATEARAVRLTKSEDFDACTHLILPGDGAFQAGMDRLEQTGLADGLKRAAEKGKFILGICLGMQLLAKQGTEFGLHPGLGLIPGRVDKMAPNDPSLPVPQIGWNRVNFQPNFKISQGMEHSSTYYFMNSYTYDDPAASYVAATFDYSGNFVAVIEKDNVFGFQFHPEKSQKAGLTLLKTFTELQ